MQECMEMIVEAVGVAGVQSLWAPLMQLEAANARQLQWLAVLACWSALTDLYLAFLLLNNTSTMSRTSTACQQPPQQQQEGFCCPRFDAQWAVQHAVCTPCFALSHVTQNTNSQLHPEVLQGQAGAHTQCCHDQTNP